MSLGCKPCPEPGLALLSSLEAHSSQQMEGAGWESASQSTGLLLLQHFQHGNKCKDLEEKQLLSQWQDLGCRLVGVSLGDSSSLSSCHPSPLAGVSPQKPCVPVAARPVGEFSCSLPSQSPGRLECTSLSPSWVLCGWIQTSLV